MKILRHLCSAGDAVIEYDETEATAKATAEAKALFERITKKEGGAAFNLNPDEKITDFSQTRGETVLVPKVVGG